ncbi:MAG: type III polyketide synthase [Ignavibacteriaceae bacterium]|nr:type III polyketide synthase [Ignavibacteriaceae bacterium]
MNMLIDISTASPPFKVSQKRVSEELKVRMGGRPAIGRMIESVSNNSGIDSRYFVIPDGEENAASKFFTDKNSYLRPDTKTRMIVYEFWSKNLSIEAVEKLLNSNNIDPADIERLITISCTGFYAPGIDYFLINNFNIPADVKRTHIGFMGCAASLIGFSSSLEALNTLGKNKNILMVSTEICSIHFQTEPTKDNILANLIFADGSAAALISKETHKPGFQITETASYLFNGSAEYMGWEIGNFGFEMILSQALPKIILEKAMPQLKLILQRFGVKTGDIKYWALHPGGRAILDSIQKGLELTDEEMIPSRTVLKNYGNMSSASILFVIKEIMTGNNIVKGEYCCAVAFGPGLTMEVALLKGT